MKGNDEGVTILSPFAEVDMLLDLTGYDVKENQGSKSCNGPKQP